MPGSKNSAVIHAQYLAPWAVYRSGIAANDNLGAVAAVTQVLDLSRLLSAASSELWVTPERTAGTGTITLTVVRVNEGSLASIPYQVVAQQTLAAHKQEYQFTGILPGLYRILVTNLTGSTWTIHATSISKLAFASAGGGGGGGTVEVPTVPFTWASGTATNVQEFSEGVGWLVNGNFAPFSTNNFTSIVYTGTQFTNLQFIALSAATELDANAATTGGTLVVENCGVVSLNLFALLQTLETLTITANASLADVTGFDALTNITTLTITSNPVLTLIDGFPALTTVDVVNISGNASLTTVNTFGALSSVGTVAIKDNPALTSLAAFTSFPTAGNFDFRNNLLPEAEVDRLLSVALASNFVGEIWLDGTGNAAPSDPDGFADVATLRGNGAVVHVNGETALVDLQLKYSGGMGSGGVFDNNQAYLHPNGLWIVLNSADGSVNMVDLADPENPAVVGTITPSSTVYAAVGHGNHVYGISTNSDIVVIDVTDPSIPLEITIVTSPAPGEISEGWHWPHVFVVSGIPYLFYNGHRPGGGDSGSVIIYDLTVPALPALTTRFRHPYLSWGGGDTAVIGDRLYITDYFARSGGTTGSPFPNLPIIHAIDISDIAAPVLLNTVEIPNPLSIGNLNGWRLVQNGGVLYMCDAVYIHQFSLDNPDLPVWETYTSAPSDVEGLASIPGLIFWGANSAAKIQGYEVLPTAPPALVSDRDEIGSVSHFWDADESNRVIAGFINGQFAVWTY